jgi:hypothetical protein
MYNVMCVSYFINVSKETLHTLEDNFLKAMSKEKIFSCSGVAYRMEGD